MKPIVIILTSTIFCLTTACAVTKSADQTSEEPVKIIKAKSASPNTSKPGIIKIGAAKSSSSLAAEAEFSAFFARMSSLENEYTEKDRQIFLSIPGAPSGGTIHEAALVVGLLRDILTPVGTSKSFKNNDIHSLETGLETGRVKESAADVSVEPAKTNPARVVEFRMREKGVDIVSSLSSNPYLKIHGIYEMVWNVISIEGNSQIFVQNMSSILKNEVLLWGDLARKLGIETDLVKTTESLSSEQNTPSGISEGDQGPIDPSLAGFSTRTTPEGNAEAEKHLTKAQEFAAREDFDRAIAEAKKVPEGTTSYVGAQNNIKNWADRAVQALRKQAAQQFRSSSAAGDAMGKKTYLTKARSYLQDALVKYPEASSLDTIKENIEIIEKELGRLN